MVIMIAEDMKIIHIGLCAGRHPIRRNDDTPVNECIFTSPVDALFDFDSHRRIASQFLQEMIQSIENDDLDRGLATPFLSCRVHLYVTGLTPLLTAFLDMWIEYCHLEDYSPMHELILMHYDRESNTYKEEVWG